MKNKKKDKIKVRRGFGSCKPYTRVHKDKKKDAKKNSCRNFKYENYS